MNCYTYKVVLTLQVDYIWCCANVIFIPFRWKLVIHSWDLLWINLTGWWDVAHRLWNSKLCCSGGMLLKQFKFIFFLLRTSPILIYVLVDLFKISQRSWMIEVTMELLPICGPVEWYSLYCLQVTCLSTILMWWTSIKKWAFWKFTIFFF